MKRKITFNQFVFSNVFCFFQPNDEDYQVVPDSKFVVSRVAFRDNSSYYMVDGKRKTYKEIATLLRGSGIDLDHNRFLILQVRFLETCSLNLLLLFNNFYIFLYEMLVFQPMLFKIILNSSKLRFNF